MYPIKTRIVRMVPLALVAVLASCVVHVGTAQADGKAHCRKPHVPNPGATWVIFDGTATCAYGDTTGLATVRAKLYLRQGNGARFRPDSWHTIEQTRYTAWFPYAASRYASGYINCANVPYTGDFRGRFRYEFHWTDSHVTSHNWESATIDSEC